MLSVQSMLSLGGCILLIEFVGGCVSVVLVVAVSFCVCSGVGDGEGDVGCCVGKSVSIGRYSSLYNFS